MKSVSPLLFFSLLLSVGCASVQSVWIKTKDLDSIEAYETFIKKYPESEFTIYAKKKVKFLYYKNAYQNAKTIDTPKAYEDFLNQYKLGEYSIKARIRLQELHFLEAEAKNTIEAYEQFINRYSKSDYVDNARKKIIELNFEKLKDKNDILAYKDFLNRFHEGTFVDTVRKYYYSILRNSKFYVEFEEDFPEGVVSFKDKFLNLLKQTDLKITDKKTCEFKIKINVLGEPIRKLYEEYPTYITYSLYTAANIKGTISAIFKEKEIFSEDFENYCAVAPPSVDNVDKRKTPSSAPFQYAFDDISFDYIIHEFLGNTSPFIDILMNRKSEGGVLYAIITLDSINDKSATEPLIEFLKKDKIYLWDDYRLVKGFAVKALVNLNDKQAVEVLIESLEYAPFEVAKALGKFKDKRATVPLIKKMQENYEWEEFQKTVSESLRKINDIHAAEMLIEWYKETIHRSYLYPDKKVREQKAIQDALLHLGNIAIDPLKKVLKDPNISVKMWAEWMLSRLTGYWPRVYY